jgi:hypothetical protein
MADSQTYQLLSAKYESVLERMRPMGDLFYDLTQEESNSRIDIQFGVFSLSHQS